MDPLVLVGADVFDGQRMHAGASLTVEGGRVAAIGAPGRGRVVDLGGGVLAPGLLDLQVNGAGGVAVGGAVDAAALAAICAAQGRLGATGVLPTLITDTAQATARVIAAGIEAVGAPGFLGLHLEGPHLDPRRKGAHDARLIRPMTEGDLDALEAAAARLPTLMVTLAPEAVTPAQVARLAAAGVIVSLGHTDCSADVAEAFLAAGATVVTHLFNAMSQMAARAPGLVGATLGGGAFAGLIADGIHVALATLRAALRARPDGLFLVSDCMAVAGTDATEMRLGGRRILRRDGRLTLEDGTLAGADLTLPCAIATLVRLGVPLERTLAMATAVPARAIGREGELGFLLPGRQADMTHLRADGSVAIWRAGRACA